MEHKTFMNEEEIVIAGDRQGPLQMYFSAYTPELPSFASSEWRKRQ